MSNQEVHKPEMKPFPKPPMMVSFDEIKKRVQESVKSVTVKLAIISGKGGVGKSFVSTSLAIGFALRGFRVGIMDADVYGPTVPKMLGIPRPSQLLVDYTVEKIIPPMGPLGVRVMSVEFLLPSEETPVIWRGPMVAKLIEEFFTKVHWGTLDFLVIDLPPGTGDEPLTIAQLLSEQLDGTIIVTIPSEVSKRIVRKAIEFSKRVGVPVIGIIENMSYFYCPKCGERYYIFGKGIGKALADETGIPFLGEIPLDPRISEACDAGIPYVLKYPDSEATKAILDIVDKLIDKFKEKLQALGLMKTEEKKSESKS